MEGSLMRSRSSWSKLFFISAADVQKWTDQRENSGSPLPQNQNQQNLGRLYITEKQFLEAVGLSRTRTIERASDQAGVEAEALNLKFCKTFEEGGGGV